VSLFAINNENVLDELRQLDVDSLTTEESKKLLAELKGRII
jgi:hypothetical protein